MNKESLEKMSHMRLLGMYQAFKSSIESDVQTQTFTYDELYITRCKASGMTGNTVPYRED